MPTTSPHRDQEHGAEAPQVNSHPHGSHSTQRHGPAASSDATGHAHHTHDAIGAEHGVGGHDKHAGHSVEMFREKFWGTLLLSIPTIVGPR
jgi:P-type Cu2+ transporter